VRPRWLSKRMAAASPKSGWQGLWRQALGSNCKVPAFSAKVLTPLDQRKGVADAAVLLPTGFDTLESILML